MRDISKLCVQDSTMIRVMSFSCAARTRRVYGWVSIICLTTAISVSVSQGLDLWAISNVMARCGENVTLTCEATLSRQDINLFSWLLATNKTCQYEDPQLDPEVLCESTAETLHHRLTLTLPNVMPVNQGNYLCKLRSKLGIKSATTVVTVQDCPGSPDSSVNMSHATCKFSGVYPSGTIHWFSGDVNLTDFGRTQVEEDQHGRYNVWSTINVPKGNQNQRYNCSLWIPSVKEYHPRHQSVISMVAESSGSVVGLQWILMMAEIMIVKFMT